MLFASAVLIAVISAGASYIQAKKAQKKAKEMTEGVESNIESNSKEIPVVYGERRVGGVRVYIDTSRDKKHKYLYMVLAMAEGEVESITDIKIDDIPITDSRFITSGNKQNLWYETYTGTDTQNVSTLIKDGVKYNTTEDVWDDPWNSQHDRDTQFPNVTYPWGDNHRLQGVAYLALKFKWDEKAYNGIPDVTAVVKGRKVYDPRTQTTGWSNNPALCIRDYLTNPRYGKGLPESAIDDVAFGQAATDCENFTVTPYTGSLDTHQLFTMDHVVDTSKKILENLNDMLLSCRAFLPYSKGVYSLKIDQPSASVLSIGADQIISGIAIAGNKKEDRFNQVKVNFFNKGLEYKEDQAIYPETNSTLYQTYLAEDDNEPLIEEVDIFSLNNFYSAREIARLILERSRQNSTIAFQGTSELINLEIGEVVSITHPTPSWTNKLFQVQEVALNFDGTVNVTCIEYDAALYTYDTPDEEQPFIGSRLPDPNQVDPITSLSVSTGSYIENDGKTIGYVDASWTAPEDELVDRYEIKFEYNSREDVIEVASSQYRFKPTQDNTDYTVSVRAVNGLGIRSDWVTHTAVTSVIDTTPPALPTGITATGGIKHITLDWTNPTDDDFDVVEIKANTTDNESTATLIATVKVDNFIHDIGTNNATRYYYLRSKDRTGNGSEWTTVVSATTVKVESGDLDVSELSDISTDLGSITGGSLNIGDGTFTVDSSGNMVATSATIEGQGTFGDGIVASSESGTLEVGRAISDGTVKVGSQLGFYSSGGGYTYESFIEFRLNDMRIFMGEGTGNFKFEGGNNTGYDFERPVTFTTTPTVDGTNVALITDIVGNTDNYADSFSINNTTGVMTIGRTGSLGDLTADISTYVGNQVSALVDSAPSTLDTLNELASALGDDPNFATTVTNSIATKANKSGDTFTGDVTFNNHVKLPQNPTGTTYGNTISTIPTAMITQRVGDNDGWRLYGEAPVTNDVKMIFEIVDDIETGDTWVFRNKKTYGDYSATEPFKIQGNGNIIATGTITASGYNNSNWDTAYGWGNHADAGYLTSVPSEYLTQTEGDSRYQQSNGLHKRIYKSNGNTGAVWYKLGNFPNSSGFLQIIGTIGSHVESFGTSRLDLTIYAREGGSGVNVSIDGKFEVAHQGTGLQVYRKDNDGGYESYDVWLKVGSYAQVCIDLNYVNFTYDGTSTTTQPDTSGYFATEIDTTTYGQGSYDVEASAVYERYNSGVFTNNASNWDTAYGWGDHSTQNYAVTTGDTFTGNVIAPSFTGRLQGAVTGAPDATIWCVSGQYTDWGIFYDEDTPDLIQFKSAGNTKASIALDNGNINTLGTITSSGNVKSSYSGTNYSQLESNASGGVLKLEGGGTTLLRSYGLSEFPNGIGIGSTTVIDSSRNLTNIASITTGTIEMNQTSTSGFFGSASFSWEGISTYPTLYGESADRWVMICFPHIPYLNSGQRGYTGATYGSLTRYEAWNDNHYDAGVLSRIGDGRFSISRYNLSTPSITAYSANATQHNVNIGGTNSPWNNANRSTLTINGQNNSLLGFTYSGGNSGYIYGYGSTMEMLAYGELKLLSNASGSYFGKLNSGIWDVSHGYKVNGTTVIDSSQNTAFAICNANSFAGGAGKIFYPSGAEYQTSGSSVAGAIKIRLPQLRSNTMMRMTVKVYEYAGGDNGTSFTLELGGYNYSNGAWYNVFANVIGDTSQSLGYNVRFGEEGGYNCIWISEPTDSWAYPQVFVTEFQGGYSKYESSRWDDNWDITFETTLGSVYKTITANQIGKVCKSSLTATNFIASGSDTSPAGTPFSNTFKGVGTSRTAYFDGDGSSVSTWYGVGNTPFSAIDSTNGNMEFWVNHTNGTWYRKGKYNVDGLFLYSSLYFDDYNTRITQGSGNSIKAQTNYGYIEIAPQNGSYCHFQTDISKYYFNKRIVVDEGVVSSYNEDLILRRAESSSHQMTLNTSGATFTGNVTAYSDITLKDNITEIDNALDKVNSIRGVTYDRIDQDNARHAGVIAQEVEEVFPEVVHTDDNGIKSVAYGNMVGLLIEAIKELKSEIEELKNVNGN